MADFSETGMSTSELPQTQKAILYNTTTSALSLAISHPLPLTSTTEHLIRVHSTAITNGELTWSQFVSWPNPHIPCFDVSGTILSTLPGSKFCIGDKVYGRISAVREGAAREYCTILPSEAALIPKGLSMTDAASIPMSAYTAWQAVFEHGLLTGSFSPSSTPHVTASGDVFHGQAASGKRVLVLGAAGGVGLFAVQFAKLAGAAVYGTASMRNVEFLNDLGINGVIDYTTTSMEDWISGGEGRKFDLVLDCVGGKSMLDGWTAVKAYGAYISVAPEFQDPGEGMRAEGVRSKWFIMEARAEELVTIGRFIGKGLVRTWVDSVWGIDDFEEAFRKTATGHARGKVVIKIAENDEKAVS